MNSTVLNIFYVVTTIIVTLVSVFYFFLKTKFTYWKKRGIVHEPPHIIFGNIKKWASKESNEPDIMDEIYSKHKDMKYVGVYYLWKPFLLIRDPGLMKKVLITDFEYIGEHADQSTLQGTDSILDSLFFQKGEVWKQRRQFFSKMFTPLRLKEFFIDIERQIQKIIPVLDAKEEKGEDIFLEEVMMKYTLAVITATLLGIESVTSDSESKFIEMTNKIMYLDTPTILKQLILTLAPRLYKIINYPVFDQIYWNYFKPITQQLIKHKESNKSSKIDIFSFLVKLKNGAIPGEDIKFEELVGHAFSFYGAGTHTTEMTLSYVLLQLSRFPKVQEKVYQEVVQVINEDEGMITYDSLKKLEYLDMVFSETLRLHPLLGVLKRVCVKDYRLDENFILEAGTEVIIPVSAIQRDPKYFPKPEEFIPERWEDSSLKSSDVYMPFGKGPRICIGMKFAEMTVKFALVTLIQRFQILPSDKMKYPLAYDPRTLIITGRPQDGFWVKLRKRSTE